MCFSVDASLRTSPRFYPVSSKYICLPFLTYNWPRRGLLGSRPLTHDWCMYSSIINLDFFSLMNTTCPVYALGFKNTHDASSFYATLVWKVQLTNTTDSGHTA